MLPSTRPASEACGHPPVVDRTGATNETIAAAAPQASAIDGARKGLQVSRNLHPSLPVGTSRGVARFAGGVSMLSIEGVSKAWRGGVYGVRDLSLDAQPGVLGLLGPNGAGKTTLMQMLATLTRPTKGRIVFDGTDVARNPDAGETAARLPAAGLWRLRQPDRPRAARVHRATQGHQEPSAGATRCSSS